MMMDVMDIGLGLWITVLGVWNDRKVLMDDIVIGIRTSHLGLPPPDHQLTLRVISPVGASGQLDSLRVSHTPGWVLSCLVPRDPHNLLCQNSSSLG